MESYDPIKHIKQLREKILDCEYPGFLDDVNVLSLIKKDYEKGCISGSFKGGIDEVSSRLYVIDLMFKINNKINQN